MDYKKISVDDEIPSEGKYIVFTRTPFGNVNVFECSLKFNSKKPSWGCNNQIVTHWLKEVK